MSTPTTRAPWLRHLGGLACAAAMAAPAHAAFVQGDWDPPFGPPFASLGWEGTVVIEVADTCGGLADGLYAASACSAVMSSALVRFYDINDTGADGEAFTPVETLVFTNSVLVNQIVVIGDQVKAFSLIGPPELRVGSESPIAVPGGSSNNAFFSLDMELNVITEGSAPPLFSGAAWLSWYQGPATGTSGQAPGIRSNIPGQVVYTSSGAGVPGQVSAPGTLALALGSLALLAALRRRT